MAAASALGGDDGELLEYATSGQTKGRQSRVVGYCSVAIY
ncbi:MAG: AmmeMemoRadiSam system protein B [Haloarculaceae archaeon]|jgi:AmmeMemoRadiSam system protein B